MSKSAPTAADVRKQLARELTDLDEPHRTALQRVHTTLQTARTLAVAQFGDAATPEHQLTLLGHLLTQADLVGQDDGALDEDE
jgi:hypothetical protein